MVASPDIAQPRSRLAALRARLGDRAIGIGVAMGIELLLLLVLLTLGTGITRPGDPDGPAITSFDVSPEPAVDEPEQAPETQPQPQPTQQAAATQPQPTPPDVQPRPEILDSPAPTPPALIIPRSDTFRLPSPQPPAPPRPRAPAAPAGPVYGPPAPPPGNGMPGDSERVGSTPNGEPMYAARWYREPTDSELAGYLSTASGPGYGLITCRTVAGYRVEDCVGLSEQPPGSNLLRAVLAAAWQFRVRPPRIGGKEQVGEWVRIRIQYSTGARPPR
ncbi:hypothetical protein V5740_00755 [Croceibacterium sp. TMG7-5b_MA50]|uniref:hypothetical protein n=1 Tax=Croceibacterium sp. TMG7-5b_MA50 TaxID=3121290 RepID=UPI003221648D